MNTGLAVKISNFLTCSLSATQLCIMYYYGIVVCIILNLKKKNVYLLYNMHLEIYTSFLFKAYFNIYI